MASVSCGCTDCACKTPPLPNSERFYEDNKRILTGGCEVLNCHRGPDANVYVVTVRAPDGRQRTGLGCVTHLGDVASRCLSGVRLEPFE